MRSGFAIFDTHTHIGSALHSGRRHTADQLLRDMDSFGVDRAVVIPFPVVADCGAAHDEIGRAVRQFPDRLTGAACLPPFLPDTAFEDEVRRCREEYGFRALKVQPQYHGLNPLSGRADFVFGTAMQNGMALICHTGSGIPFSLPSLYMPPAKKFPDLKIVLAHCGGGGIFHMEGIVAAMFCTNIYLELSSLLPHHVLEVLAHVSSERLMIGSDLPESLEAEAGKILNLSVPHSDKRNILFETAVRVFGGSGR